MDEYYLALAIDCALEAEKQIQLARKYLARAGGLGEYEKGKFTRIINAIKARCERWTYQLGRLSDEKEQV